MAGRIQKLSEDVINRIAAGEVVLRPASALKELLENSLDAQSTSISIVVKQGGQKLLQITDNGCGIRKEDLEIVCERFTTSKLKQYDELQSISTFGFRGEALASVSHVAHLSIVTCCRPSDCAFLCRYRDGSVVEGPTPCAGTPGTTVAFEDLFYNMPARKRAQGSAAEEYSRILEVVQRYSLQNPAVQISCKKFGSAVADLRSPGGCTSTKQVAEMIFGSTLTRELIPIYQCSDAPAVAVTMKGLVSNANYSRQKLTVILFINNRLVESAGLRKVAEDVYEELLPRGQHPWVFMSLSLCGSNVDVNVHPTKKQVHFLEEEAVFQFVGDSIREALRGRNDSRSFAAPLPGLSGKRSSGRHGESESKRKLLSSNPTRVRTDTRQLVLSGFRVARDEAGPRRDPGVSNVHELTSVNNLVRSIAEQADSVWTESLTQSVFVGSVSEDLALLQTGSQLILVNLEAVALEAAYQMLLRNFGCHKAICFAPPIPISPLLTSFLKSHGSCSLAEAQETADAAVAFLVSKSEMLSEYFGMCFAKEGLQRLPQVFGKAVPDLSALPLFCLTLCTQVDWGEEQSCFEGLCRALSHFFVSSTQRASPNSLRVFFESFHLCKSFRAPVRLTTDGSAIELTRLEQLYRIFERC
mmetsp:Transcript_81135/g.216779  ORF Transcript_81135/g.216779 Transcript_81135/m.216779 type:complete len:640 (-) Transcript_81135:70-1989(-)